jgi:DtxR family transcriptional regulator, Mn-dependent transcriptional regulator
MGHYLMAVRDQLKESGYARVTDIATRLDISRSSVSVALASLRNKGYLTEDDNHFFKLTESGENLAREIYGNHLLLETFFQSILQVSEDTALIDACKIEHLLSTETSRKMLCFVRYLIDNEDELKVLLEKINHHRKTCPHVNSCGVCVDQDECPFFHTTKEK